MKRADVLQDIYQQESMHPNSTLRTIQELLKIQYGQEYTFKVMKKLASDQEVIREKQGREYVYSAPGQEISYHS